MSAPQDVVLVIATPLLVVAAFAWAQHRSEVEALLVALAMGHHLPGMMRAYGDRDLFARFRSRFVVAPVLLLPACLLLSIHHLAALSVVVVTWGIWHGMAQVYGFARIYDAKRGESSAHSRRLDLALCISWFGAGVLLSPERLGGLLQDLYTGGAPLFAPAAVHGFQTLWMAGTAIVSVAFVVNLCISWRRGRAPNLPKLALLVSSCGFWWYAMVGIQNAILGIAWFELFHDIQYLTIVWSFNCRVVEKGGRVGGFTSFLFRHQGAKVAIYLGLILAYGAFNPLKSTLYPDAGLARILTGIIAASTLLHFYYDGFIWKLRDRSLTKGLDLEGAGAEPASSSGWRHRVVGWRQHATGWALLAAPALGLVAAQILLAPGPKLDAYASIAEAVPEYPSAQMQLGDALHDQQRLREAQTAYAKVIELRPGSVLAHTAQGRILADQGHFREAIGAYRNVLNLDPDDVSTRVHLGNAAYQLGDLVQARTEFERVLALDPDNYAAATNLGAVCERRRDLACARRQYQRAIRIDPNAQVPRQALRRVRAAEAAPTG